MIWKVFGLLCLFLIVVTAADEDRPEYTENLQKFKGDKHKTRLELLVGCWLMSRDHHPTASESEKLMLIKTCLRHITRKDSVVKITSLIGKNMTETKTYDQVVPKAQMPETISFSSSENSEFDRYLLNLVQNYQKDLIAVQKGEGETIKKKIDQQMQKRQKYYFGIIPANQWTHLLFLISISLLLVMLCTCWKYFQMRKLRQQAKSAQKNKDKDYFKQASAFTKNAKTAMKKNV